MSVTLTIKESVTVLGNNFPSETSVTADGAVTKDVEVPAAKVGQLTTRTSGTVGTLTMTSGHGITTAARLDLYWVGGSRRGITVGTVATNSVPFTLGEGDDLPANLTAITAMVPVEEAFLATGDDVEAILMRSTKNGTIVLAESDDGEVLAKVIGGGNGTTRCYTWAESRDPVNPVAGDDIAKVFFSHGDSTGPALMNATVLIS